MGKKMQAADRDGRSNGRPNTEDATAAGRAIGDRARQEMMHASKRIEPWQGLPITVTTSWPTITKKKDELSEEEKAASAREINTAIEMDMADHVNATDGPLAETTSGAAVVVHKSWRARGTRMQLAGDEDTQFWFRIEVVAMMVAIKVARKWAKGRTGRTKVSIYSDWQSLLAALQSDDEDDQLIRALRLRYLKCRGIHFTTQYVPSHIRVRLNEAANQMAGEARKDGKD